MNLTGVTGRAYCREPFIFLFEIKEHMSYSCHIMSPLGNVYIMRKVTCVVIL